MNVRKMFQSARSAAALRPRSGSVPGVTSLPPVVSAVPALAPISPVPGPGPGPGPRPGPPPVPAVTAGPGPPVSVPGPAATARAPPLVLVSATAGAPGVDGDPQVPPVVGPAVEGVHGVLEGRVQCNN